MSQSEELLVQLLDGTLNAADRRRLETLMSQDESLAEEVRELQQVENLLTERADITHAGSSEIRADVLNSIRAEYVKPAAAGSSKTLWYGGGAVLLVAAAALIWIGTSGDANMTGAAEQPNTIELTPEFETDLTLELDNPPEPELRQFEAHSGTDEATGRQTIDGYWPGPEQQNELSQPPVNDNSAPEPKADEPQSANATQPSGRSSGTIDGNASPTSPLEQQLREAVESLQLKMREHHAQGNAALEASTAHRLADVYAKLGDRAAAAEQYKHAGDLAATQGLRALEAQSRADLALLNAATDRDATMQTVRESINTLRELGRDTKSYEKALEQLQD